MTNEWELVQSLIDQSDPRASDLVPVDDALHPAGHAGEGVLTLVDNIPGQIISHVSRIHLRSIRGENMDQKVNHRLYTPP